MKSEVEVAKNEMASKADEKIADVDRALAAGTKDLEVKESRRDMDGVEHDTLKLRLESDLKKGKVIEETKEGTYLSFNDTVGGIVSDIEVLGNTVQDVSNLANIRSSCIPNGDGTYKMSILSVGENLMSSKFELGGINSSGGLIASNEFCRTIEFVPVPPNSNIVASSSNSKYSINRYLLYDVNEKLISTSVGSKVATTPDTRFIKYVVYDSTATIKLEDVNSCIQLEEGTVATPYTPYEETRCDIKLPCQLEKGDRLYYDKVENTWVVDKYMHEFSLEDKISINVAQLTNTYRFEIVVNHSIAYNSVVSAYCDRLNYIRNYSLDEEHFYTNAQESGSQVKSIWVFVNKETIDSFEGSGSVDRITNYLNSGIRFLYTLNTPQKIVLPQGEQIKLNSFANKTHIYTISDEVDATVKATVSKSLASTVQANTNEINILSNKVADIQGLKESQDFAYETDKGCLVCKDTQSGVVKDLKIYGKTIVSRFSKKHTETNITVLYAGVLSTTGFKVEVGKTYTVLGSVKSPTKNMCDLYYQESNANIGNFKGVPFVFTANKNETLRFVSLETGLYALEDIMVLEGDYSQNAPSYFEGIASVGNSNEIEVSSIKWSGNLFNEEQLKPYIKSENDIEYEINYEKVWTDKAKLAQLPFKENTQYKFICSQKTSTADSKPRFYFVYTDGSKDEITIATTEYTEVTGLSRANKTLDYISVTYGVSGAKFTVKKNSICLYENTSKNVYEPFKQDKKTILFKDTDNTWKPISNLRGINENNYDVIDSANNIYSVRVKEITNLKDLRWTKEGSFENKDTYFYKLEDGLKNVDITQHAVECVCDKLKSVSVNYITGAMHSVVDCVAYDVRYQVIRISVPKDTNLVEYLTNLNPRFIYPLGSPLNYEINPIYPESYENETMISFGSGAIAPHASWKITSSLPNFVKELSNQIKQLQEQVYKTNVANFAVALNTLDTKLRLDRLEAPQM
ncbi:MAG: hypothetical protein ACRDDM_05075 [Paraclostridium sp.]